MPSDLRAVLDRATVGNKAYYLSAMKREGFYCWR